MISSAWLIFANSDQLYEVGGFRLWIGLQRTPDCEVEGTLTLTDIAHGPQVRKNQKLFFLSKVRICNTVFALLYQFLHILREFE